MPRPTTQLVPNGYTFYGNGPLPVATLASPPADDDVIYATGDLGWEPAKKFLDPHVQYAIKKGSALHDFIWPARKPAPAQASGVEARVCEDIRQRQLMGIAKYKTTLEDNPAGRVERIRHAYEEALDLAVYLKWELEKAEEEARG
jgi:hypothetical protein